jgi:hypothetical protein
VEERDELLTSKECSTLEMYATVLAFFIIVHGGSWQSLLLMLKVLVCHRDQYRAQGIFIFHKSLFIHGRILRGHVYVFSLFLSSTFSEELDGLNMTKNEFPRRDRSVSFITVASVTANGVGQSFSVDHWNIIYFIKLSTWIFYLLLRYVSKLQAKIVLRFPIG